METPSDDATSGAVSGRFSTDLLGTDIVMKEELSGMHSSNSEIFSVTPKGEVLCDGKAITDDDAAMADCLRRWVKVQTGITVRKRVQLVDGK